MGIPTYSAAAQQEFLADISQHFGGVDFLTKEQIDTFVEERSLPVPSFLLNTKTFKGKYRVANSGVPGLTSNNDKPEDSFVEPVVDDSPPVDVQEAIAVAEVATLEGSPVKLDAASHIDAVKARIATNSKESLHPKIDPTYVPFGFYNDLKMIISAKIFYPVYVTGLSGNGKTLMIEQVCADLKRECIRVNITKETDETDLIGSYELVDGNTVRREGPVIVAMKRGAILLLDETDYGSERLLCLQPILEGKPYFDKKTGELVYPASGFNVIATANTKGKGSDDGRFIGANVLNEAFLERFAITVEQEYPETAVEKKILLNNFAQNKIRDDRFADHLVSWADVIRKSYLDGAVDEIISTRRLVHIIKAFSIFGNRLKAIELCLNRFDSETKISFLDIYTKIDPTAKPAEANTTDYVTPDEKVDADQTAKAPQQPTIPPQQTVIPPTQPTATNTLGGIHSQSSWNPAPVVPPQKKVKSKSVPTAAPVKPVVVAWATPAMVAKTTEKFGTRIKIVTDTVNGCHYISSHGQTVTAKDARIASFAPDGVLDMLVDINLKASEGIDIPNPFL